MLGYLKIDRTLAETIISSNKWPINAQILAIGDTVQFGGNSTQYTVASVSNGGISSSVGELTFTITPGLDEAKSASTIVIVPTPRIIATAMKTATGSEAGTICYFMQFNFETIKHISAFSTYSGVTKVTCTSHGFSTNNHIRIDQTDNYDSPDPDNYDTYYTITKIDDDNFTIPVTFVATESGVAKKDATIYIATTIYDIVWDSKTFQAVGGMLQFEEISETSDMQASGVNILLSGVDQLITTLVLGKAYRGRFVKVWLGHINTSGTIISDPLLIFWGRMNGGFEIEENRDTDSPGTVNVRGNMEDRFASLSRVVGIMTNVPSHQHYFPTDKFFSFVAKLVGKRLVWGKPAKQSASGGGCFITTAVLEIKYKNDKKLFDDNCSELKTLRFLRDNYVRNLPEGDNLIKEYSNIAPRIITEIDKRNNNNYIYEVIYKDLIIPVTKLIRSEKYEEALTFYKNYIHCLKKIYLHGQ